MVDENIVKEILNNFLVDSVVGIERVDAWIHPSFRVSLDNRSRVFLRFPAVRDNVHFNYPYNFDKDVYVSDLLLQNDITVPRFVFRDTYKDHDFLIVEDLRGVNLGSLCRNGMKSAPENLIEGWGNYIARVHSITSDSFGYIGKNGIDKIYNSWGNVVFDFLRMKIDRNGVVDSEDKNRIILFFKRNLELLNSLRDPRLILYNTHGDNMIVDGNKFVGVSDVMLSFFGDRSLDFMFPFYFEVQDAFTRGYVGAGGVIPEHLDTLNKFNLVNYYLSTIVNYKDATGRRATWSEDYRKKLKLLLNE